MRTYLTAVAIAIAAIGAPVHVLGQTAGAVVTKEPGKVTMADAARVSATVQAIDKDERQITLKGPEGSRSATRWWRATSRR